MAGRLKNGSPLDKKMVVPVVAKKKAPAKKKPVKKSKLKKVLGL